MKTENFDDAIRRKIESINYSYQEEDIARVHHFVKQKQLLSSLRRYGLIGATSIAGISIACLLLWNLNQLNENKVLHQTINTLQNHLNESKNNIAIVKTDTVFIKESVKTSNINSSPTKTNELEETNNENNSYANYQKVNSEMDLPPTVNNSNIVSKQIENNSNIPALIDNDKINTPAKENYDNHEMVSIINKTTVKDSVASIVNPASQTNFLTTNETSQENLISNETKNHTSFHPFKNLHYLAGIGGEIANNQVGGSILGEVYYNHRLSVGVGAKLLSITNENYYDDDDFLHTKHRNFSRAYDIYPTDTSKNIKIKSLLIQLPISINYLCPLKNNFSLLFSVGTDIDLYVVQDVVYRHRKNSSADVPADLYHTSTPVMFNNIVISAGIQKQWKFIVAQLSPFVSPQLTYVVYKKEDLYYGVQLRILYSFGKTIKFV